MSQGKRSGDLNLVTFKAFHRLIYFKELRLKAAYNDVGQKSKQCMILDYYERSSKRWSAGKTING